MTLSFHDLITFLETNVYNNHELSKKITPKLKENINRLKNFATTKELSRLRTSSDLASILGVDETQVKQLLILYNSSNPTSKITLTNLANFINKKVLTNNTYKNYLGNDQKALLNQAKPFLDKKNITTKYDAKTIAKMFGLNETDVSSLFMYYESLKDINETMTIEEFTDFTLNTVYQNKNYKSLFDNNTLANLKLLSILSKIGRAHV